MKGSPTTLCHSALILHTARVVAFRKPFAGWQPRDEGGEGGGSTICWIVGAEGRRLKANHFSLFSPQEPRQVWSFPFAMVPRPTSIE